VIDRLTSQQWAQYNKDGYVILGKLLQGDRLKQLQDRIDDIMMGRAALDYSRLLMQLDSTSGKYEDAGPQTKGFKEATLSYRKIQDLEFDPVFLEYMQWPLFRHICEEVYGKETPIACFRAMFFNKPAGRGTQLPWHQDRWTALDRDPLITIWTALDPATIENGCVELIPASHDRLWNPSHGSGFLSPEQQEEVEKNHKKSYLQLEPGEVALLHNWTLHRSDVNRSQTSRRAFSACYMDANTIDQSGRKYPVLFGEGALKPEAVTSEKA
jgi:hypothetical protein